LRVIILGKRGELMWRCAASEKDFWLLRSLLLGIICLIASPALGGTYRDSAHGSNPDYGVNRSSIDAKYASFATGNCAHCHEAHASFDGTEPAPALGPAPHTLFADSFNTSRTLNLYLMEDNFCFYCHNNSSGPQVINQDYSTTFGGGVTGEGPQSIMAAFNEASYHNLNDIYNFLTNNDNNLQDVSQEWLDWFAKRNNPCSACHNSHLAKRNWDSGLTGFPLLSAISKPGESDNLWGETDFMSTYFEYEAPYAILNNTREPASIGEVDGGNTPDYVSFCTSCHTPDNILWSTTLNRELKKINWGETGLIRNKHGDLSRDGTNHFQEPYETAAASKTDFVLSCLDCHESHGSENVMMLRRRINGQDLEGTVASTDTMSYACKRCHTDDLAAVPPSGQPDQWEYVHHLVTDAPYVQVACDSCHDTAGGGEPIACGNCHGHGMDDSWSGLPVGLQTLRITF